MKKNLLVIFFVVSLVPFAFSQRDTIAGWTFPAGTDTDKYANEGLSVNIGAKDISAEDTTANSRPITWTNGVTSGDYAATADHWNDGAYARFWSVKITASGYKDIQVSSRQRAGNNPPGPKYFKLQYKIGSIGTWADVSSDTITLANDWTTGVVANLELPEAADDPSSTLYIRWILISNENIAGTTLDSAAISKIDDVLISGVAVSGVERILYSNKLIAYPNPATNIINIASDREIESILIYNISGAVVYSGNPASTFGIIDASNFEGGLYTVKVKYSGTAESRIIKIMKY